MLNRYFFIKFDLGKMITFDINESLSLEGDTASYIQYAYARGKHLVGVYTDWRLQFKFQTVNLMIECSLNKLVHSLDELQVYLHEKP